MVFLILLLTFLLVITIIALCINSGNISRMEEEQELMQMIHKYEDHIID